MKNMKNLSVCLKCKNKYQVYEYSEGKELFLCFTCKLIDDILSMTVHALNTGGKTRQGRLIDFDWHYLTSAIKK